MKRFLISLAALLLLSSALSADDSLIYREAAVTAETDPIVGAVDGIVKADGAGNVAAAEAGDFPTLNQNTTGTAAGLSGTPALPDGTTATTQSASDNSTKLATTAYVDTGLATKVANDGTVNPTNLLSNGNFESWSAGTSAPPDGWTLNGGSAAVAREATTIKIGTYSAKITRNGDDCQIYTRIHEEKGINYFKGRNVTFSCWVNATVASRARIFVYDGVGLTYSSYHSGGSSWELLTVTRTINASATLLQCSLAVDTGDTSAYFDGATLVEGTSKFAYAPKPADITTGTFTPVLTDGTNNVTTYYYQYGRYTKIGNLCFFAITISVNNKGSITGDIYITGLPITPKNYSNNEFWNCSVKMMINVAGVPAATIYNQQTSGNTGIRLFFISAGGQTALQGSSISGGSQIFVEGFYYVD